MSKAIQLRLKILALLLCATLIDVAIAHFWWLWYSWAPVQPEENRDALVAVAGVASVVWTGGLVAYTIYRRYSPQLSVGIGVVQVAYILPIVGLICHGATLRSIAFAVGFTYALWAAFGLRLYLASPKGLTITVGVLDGSKKDDPAEIAAAKIVARLRPAADRWKLIEAANGKGRLTLFMAP